MTKIDGVPTNIMSLDTYKGNSMVVFGSDRRFPFQFGVGKARLLLAAIDEMGADKFVSFLKGFVTTTPEGTP